MQYNAMECVQVYHWTAFDRVDVASAAAGGDDDDATATATATATTTTRRALLYGWAWLLAIGELLVGGDARRLATSADYATDMVRAHSTNRHHSS